MKFNEVRSAVVSIKHNNNNNRAIVKLGYREREEIVLKSPSVNHHELKTLRKKWTGRIN